MKLTLNWLREFVDLPADPEEVRDALEGLGHEVEAMSAFDVTFRGVVVGKVLEITAHPDADKVRVCRVDLGGEVAEIVCGAWNFAEGAVVPVAVPGAVIGGTFEITRRDIRGVVSNGMICSESELGLGDDHAGIMVLDDDYPAAAGRIGADFASLLPLPDTFFDVFITPNRPDAMSVIGLARDLAAHYRVPLRLPRVEVDERPPPSEVTITIEDPAGCPRYVGREVRGIAVGPSPHAMRMRLAAAGVRPINNVVDASNYVLMEMGHPTHAFDLERLGQAVVVRRAREGETIVTLDDVERRLVPGDVVIADATRPVAIAGVMGGADTEVDDGTTRILIEAAHFDPPSVLHTSKRLALRSEASARFERGMDPNLAALAADRVAQLVVATGGGEVVAGAVDAYPRVIEPRRVTLPLAEVRRVLGIDLPGDVISGYLERLGFGVSGTDPLDVEVPTRRPDVSRPVDLVEEIARLHGFDAIEDRVATGPGGGLPYEERMVRRLRDVLVGAGFSEAMTFSFIGGADLDALDLPDDDRRRSGITVVNPLRDEEGVMRTTLLPGLLKVAATNVARHLDDVTVFEVGKAFIPGEGPIPDQPDHLAFVAAGTRAGGLEEPDRAYDVWDATAVWELVARELRLPGAALAPVAAAGFHPERAAEVLVDGIAVGVVGEVHPSVAAAFGLSGRVAAGEIELAPLVAPRERWTFSAPSQFPPVIFDLAFEVDESVAAASLLRLARRSGGPLVEGVEVFDVFTGPPVTVGRKSLAIRLTLRDPARTLTDADGDTVRRSIQEAVAAELGGTLRGGT
jgi:phenylalanyl-tRNA synthetase beta chain